MNITEFKLSLFEKIESLETNKFYDVYGLILNYINGERDIDEEWNLLSKEQKNGIYIAIKEIDSGKQISHENVISKFRVKYGNE